MDRIDVEKKIENGHLALKYVEGEKFIAVLPLDITLHL